MTAVIEAQSISRVYAASERVWALNECTFSVNAGEMIAVVGPSGSGKSTLLNCLGLLERPTSGRYRLLGWDTASLSERERAGLRSREIGFVFQDYHLMRGRSASENVALGMLYQGVPAADRKRRAKTLLESVGLSHRSRALAETLSGGERQRVAIARALSGEPRLLLCDEPTGNLDTKTGRGILELLRELSGQRQTIVVVTHDGEVAAATHRTLTMLDGRISEGG